VVVHEQDAECVDVPLLGCLENLAQECPLGRRKV